MSFTNVWGVQATQCLQNMNLALGYGEYEGIPLEERA